MLFSSNEEHVSERPLSKHNSPIGILEDINFDGENYQSVYTELIKYLAAKGDHHSCSIREKELLKQIVDSVTDSDEKFGSQGVKTTSILKKKRTRVTEKLKVSYPPVPYLVIPPQATPLVSEDAVPQTTSHSVEKKEYIIRDNGRRAKVFSARFDEDYEELLVPQEAIQVEKLPFSSKPAEVLRIEPTFSQDFASSVSQRQTNVLVSEAHRAIELERSSAKAAAEFSESQKTQFTQLTNTQSSNSSIGNRPMSLETISSTEAPKLSFSAPDKPMTTKFAPLNTNEDAAKQAFTFQPSPVTEDKNPFEFSLPAKQSQSETDSKFSLSQPTTSSHSFTFPERKNDNIETVKPTFSFSTKPAENDKSNSSAFKFEPNSFDSKKLPEDKNTPFVFEPPKKEDSKSTFTFNISQPAVEPSKDSNGPLALNFKTESGSQNSSNPSFSFGANTEKPSEPFKFSFGQPASQPTQLSPIASGTTSQKQAAFSFPSTHGKQAFSFSQPQSSAEQEMAAEMPVSFSQPAAKKPFTFGSGSSQESVFTFNSTQSPSQSFAFGNNQSASQPLSFNFGNSSSQTPSTQTNFQFGQNASQQAAPSFSFGASKPSFNVSQSQPAPSMSFGGNNFQSDGPAPSSPQSTLSASSLTTSGRKISQPLLRKRR